MTNYTTPQEEFWATDFGDSYIDRNVGADLVAGDTRLFAEILSRTNGVRTVLEFGANIGLNLQAIRTLLPTAAISAIEINKKACEQLRQSQVIGLKDVFNESILDFEVPEKYDFVFIKTVLIHINPDKLDDVYRKLYDAGRKYVCLCEYFNPVPMTVEYRGHKDRLFKRDFAGEMMDKYPDLKLVDYGFIWKRDNNFVQDNVTWFLLEK